MYHCLDQIGYRQCQWEKETKFAGVTHVLFNFLRWGIRNKNAHVEYTGASTHHESRLVKGSGARGIINWLAVVQDCPSISHVCHGRKLRVPRPELQWGYLRYTLAKNRSLDAMS